MDVSSAEEGEHQCSSRRKDTTFAILAAASGSRTSLAQVDAPESVPNRVSPVAVAICSFTHRERVDGPLHRGGGSQRAIGMDRKEVFARVMDDAAARGLLACSMPAEQ